MRSGIVRFLGVVTSCVGLLALLTSFVPVLLYSWTNALSSPWGDERGDELIVLGGDLISRDMLGVSSYWRCCYAVRAWNSGHYGRIIITGKDVAPLMRDCLVSKGVPGRVIVLEGAATSTRENALYVAELLRDDKSRKVLLTSDFHMGRAVGSFRRVGLSVQPLPIPDAGKFLSDWTKRWEIFWALAQETIKVGYYKVEGWS